jgi:hypothetical protein
MLQSNFTLPRNAPRTQTDRREAAPGLRIAVSSDLMAPPSENMRAEASHIFRADTNAQAFNFPHKPHSGCKPCDGTTRCINLFLPLSYFKICIFHKCACIICI